MRLLSPAKLNVFLEVLGKRADGFHELETVMLRTNLHDVMTFETTAGTDVSLHLAEGSQNRLDGDFPLDNSNLILKAAAALRSVSSQTCGAKITIEKRIPMQAGLAGGSSNAATALLGLNELWELELPRTELHRIAATLGSDINFFIEDCDAAICRGRGEIVTPIPVAAPFHFVAARPSAGNSTPQVFANLQLPDTKRSSNDVVLALSNGESPELSTTIFNRLTAPAESVNTEMAALLRRMHELTDQPVFMSGSGSTCFVVCSSENDAAEIAMKCRTLDAVFLQAMSSTC